MPQENYAKTYTEYIDEALQNDSIIPVILEEEPVNKYKLSKHFLNDSQIDQINEYIGKVAINDNFTQNSESPSFGLALASLLATILVNSLFLQINKYMQTEKIYPVILKTN